MTESAACREEFEVESEFNDDVPLRMSQDVRSFDRDEARAFRLIDRDEEDRLVCQFKKTKDVYTLKQLLDLRDQTIRYMARKYAYLDNEDDMYSEFKGVWLKCVKRYDPSIRVRPMRTRGGQIILDDNGKVRTVTKKTPFNTYLYTSMKNRVWNILKRRHSKRLLDENGEPVAETNRSLDYEYGEDGETTLKDVIPDTKTQSTLHGVQMAEIIGHLCAGDPDVSRAVSHFISNPHFDTLTAACNFRTGTLRVTQWDRDVLALGIPDKGEEPNPTAKAAADLHLRKMVASTGTFHPRFELVDYSLNKSSVDFVIRVDDHKIFKKVKDAVLRCRHLMADAKPEGWKTLERLAEQQEAKAEGSSDVSDV